MQLPRLLVIDDLFGRIVPNSRNTQRDTLCASFLWRDVTDDHLSKEADSIITAPVCETVFFRGQTPQAAVLGNMVENDLSASLGVVRTGWTDAFAKGELPWSMVLLDLCFYTGKVTSASNMRAEGTPEGRSGDDDSRSYFGLTLLDAIHNEFPELPVLILSSKTRGEVSLEFTERGAVGFIDRTDLDGKQQLLDALWYHGLLPDSEQKIAGNSLPVLLALRDARRASRRTHGNLLIRGERGTGKELFSRYAHQVSCEADSAKRPFVTVNSAVLSPELFASELFGIMKNTATGVDGKTGLIDTAHGGDLFLDEIGDMQPEVQAALLRVLQDGQFTPVGARDAKEVDVRFISATNIDLEDGKFRRDLLDRLRSGGDIRLPPLRERKGDIPLLAEKFVRQAEAELKARRRDITLEALHLLISHDWPGNVRELQSCINDAVNSYADVEHLVPSHLRAIAKSESITAEPVEQAPVVTASNIFGLDKSIDVDVFLRFQDTVSFERQNIAAWAGSYADFEYAHAKMMSRYLKAALEQTMKHTVEQPEGVIQIHPGLKLMTGDRALSPKKAYDLIKQILAPLESELDGILREAYDKAVINRGRPKTDRFPRKRKL